MITKVKNDIFKGTKKCGRMWTTKLTKPEIFLYLFNFFLILQKGSENMEKQKTAVCIFEQNGDLSQFYINALSECRERRLIFLEKLKVIDPMDDASIHNALQIISISLSTEAKILKVLRRNSKKPKND